MSIKNVVLGMGITGVVIASSLTVNMAPSVSQTPAPDKMTFSCTQIHDPASGGNIPATLVWNPAKKENVRLIGWKSNYFDKIMTAQKRCEVVTKRFQDKYDSGNLKYINVGKVNGYPILCGLKNETDPCNASSQLFTLKKYNNPDKIKQALTIILEGKTSDLIMQNAGNSPISFADALKNAAPVKK